MLESYLELFFVVKVKVSWKSFAIISASVAFQVLQYNIYNMHIKTFMNQLDEKLQP